MEKTNFTFAHFRKLLFLTVFACCFTSMQNLQAQCNPVTGISFIARCDGSADLSFTAGSGNIDWNISIDENGVPFAFIPNAGTTAINIAGVTVGAAYDISITGLCAGGVTASASTLAIAVLAAPVNPSYTITGVSSVAPTCAGFSDGSITFTINDPTDVACTSGYTYSGTAGGVVYSGFSAGTHTVPGVSAGATTITSVISPTTCGICTIQDPAATNLTVAAGTDGPATFDVIEQFGSFVTVIQDGANAAATNFNLAAGDCVIDLIYDLTDIRDDGCGSFPTHLFADNLTTGAAVLVSGPDGLGDWQLELGDLGDGTYTIRVEYTDNGGNSTSQTFAVTINDVTGPTLNTGGANTITIDACDAATSVPLPDFTGSASDCSGILSVTQSPAAGTTTGIGTTSVTVTATDNNGNSTSETFDVTVSKGIDAPPVVVLTGNSHVFIPACETFVTVSYNLIVTDDCDNVTGIGLGNIINWDGPNPPGGAFSLDPNSVNFTIDVTAGVDQQLTASYTDAAGNQSFADIFVTAEPHPPATSVACNDNVIVALEPSLGLCQATITPDMVLEGGDGGCLDAFVVDIQDGVANGNILDGIGTFIYTVTGPNGFTCWGQVTGEDKLIPNIHCVDATITCIQDADNTDYVPFPTADDNCDLSPSIELISETGPGSICTSGTTTITRVYVAHDNWGNTSAPCTQTITITRTTPVFPDDIDLNCNTNPDVNDLSLTGDVTNVNGIAVDCKYNVTYSDETLSDCGTTFKVVRTWTVLDWCTNTIITSDGSNDNVQIIKVIDNTGPNVPMSDYNISATHVGVHPHPCYSTGPLRISNVSDDCNDVVSSRIFTEVGEAIGGIIPAPGLELGDHIVTYVAEDACGNITTNNVTVTVIDDIAPTVVCDKHTDVSLTTDGFAVVNAITFDDGSYDNCCLDFFEVKRMGEPDSAFGPTVTFDCADAAASDLAENAHTVVLRVWDCAGNYNTCMVSVNVWDKIPPVLTCPPDPDDISCDYFWENIEGDLSLATTDAEKSAVLTNAGFGDATGWDNCDYTISVSFTNTIDQCGNGSLIRTWTIVDPHGNVGNSCSQTVGVFHVSDWVVEFPVDLTVECGNALPDSFGEPNFFFVTCELVATSFTDQTFDVVPDACFKIVRTWVILNWCTVGDFISDEVIEDHEATLNVDLDGDGDKDTRTFQDGLNSMNYPLSQPDGYITYQQVIKIIDTVDPEFTDGCVVPDVCITDNTCAATVTLPTPAIAECSDVIWTVTTTDLGSGFGPFSGVAAGTYTTRYTVMDRCGNSNSCESTWTVSDCKKPTPICHVLSTDLMQTGMVTIPATDFDPHANSFDNCPGTLKYSYSSDVSDVTRTYTCADIGVQAVELWVTDEAGNQDFCQTTIVIQDNMGACPGDPLVANTGGAISNEELLPVQNVTVELSGQSNATISTDAGGSYTFAAIPIGNDITVTPSKDDDPLNGVSTFDLVLISKHILGVQPLDSPYKIIAADANNTGTVTTSDLVELRKLILQIVPNFTNNTSWRFVDKAFVFPNPANPFATTFNEVININNIPADVLDADFVAVKVGDVNSNAATGSLLGADDRNAAGTLTFNAKDVAVEAGAEYTVDFTANDFNVQGYQFTMNFNQDALDFVELLPGIAKEENFGFALLDRGAITASWNGNATGEDVIFSMVFRAKSNAQLSDLISINSRYTSAEAYNQNGDLLDVELAFNGNKTAADFELYQNIPNPFQAETIIGFNLPEAGNATLSIQDVSGRVISQDRGEFAKGYNEFRVSSSNLPSAGVLYYTIETATNTATKKMILVK